MFTAIKNRGSRTVGNPWPISLGVSHPEFARVHQRITATVIDFVLVFGASPVALLFVPNGIAVAIGDLPPEAASYWLPLVAAIPSIGFPAYGSLLVLLTRG